MCATDLQIYFTCYLPYVISLCVGWNKPLLIYESSPRKMNLFSWELGFSWKSWVQGVDMQNPNPAPVPEILEGQNQLVKGVIFQNYLMYLRCFRYEMVPRKRTAWCAAFPLPFCVLAGIVGSQLLPDAKAKLKCFFLATTLQFCKKTRICMLHTLFLLLLSSH